MARTSARKKKVRRPIKSGIKVRRPGIHGKGVYATRSDLQRHPIIEYTGRRLPWKKAMNLPPYKNHDPKPLLLGK